MTQLAHDWMDHAACVGHPTPGLFFPDKGQTGSMNGIQEARRICTTCPVIDLCAAYASQFTRLEGVWAGTTPDQRAAGTRIVKTTPHNTPPPPCTYPGCARNQHSRELCQTHYRQQWTGKGLTPLPDRKPECAFPGCRRKPHGLGLCHTHHDQQNRGRALAPIGPYTTPAPATCTYPGCGRPHAARGYCNAHYRQHHHGETLRPLRPRNTNPPDTCTYPGCDRPHRGRGYCAGHYKQHSLGRPLTPLRTTGATP